MKNNFYILRRSDFGGGPLDLSLIGGQKSFLMHVALNRGRAMNDHHGKKGVPQDRGEKMEATSQQRYNSLYAISLCYIYIAMLQCTFTITLLLNQVITKCLVISNNNSTSTIALLLNEA